MIEQNILVKNINTNYKVFGEGKPFLILHGWNSNSERWQKIGEELSKSGLKVIIADMPGFGKSDIPKLAWDFNNYVSWFEEFVKILNLENFDLLGHSFGGAISIKVAVDVSQKVSKLFLVSAACIRKKTFVKKTLSNFSKIVKIFSFLPYYPIIRKGIYKYIIRKSDYVYTDGIMKDTYLKVISEDLSCHLSFIRVPTIIIWGDKDESTPIENAHFINQKIRNSKLEIIKDIDHNIHKNAPEILIEKILENI